jgi:hypothetical protein
MRWRVWRWVVWALAGLAVLAAMDRLAPECAPGRYFVRVEVSPTLDYTTPNSGDDATDSDVVFTARAYDVVTARAAGGRARVRRLPVHRIRAA